MRYLVATHLQVLVVESSSKSVGQVAQVVGSVQVAQVSKQSKRYGCGKLPRQSVPETYFFAGHSHRLFAVFSVNCVLMQVAQVVPLDAANWRTLGRWSRCCMWRTVRGSLGGLVQMRVPVQT